MTRVQMLKGTLDMLVLRALTTDPKHGYDIIEWVRSRSNGLLEIDDAALYQALHRLEDRGCLRSEWGLSDNNRRAKYYTLTPRGRKALTRENESWRTYVQAVVTVMAPERAE